ELPQPFETSEPLAARSIWNVLKPRLSRPQTALTIDNGGDPRIYLKGISTNLKPNDPLLIDFGTGPLPVFVRVQEVRPDPVANRTLVRLQKPPVAKPAPSSATPEAIASDTKHLLRTIIARYREGAMELRGAPRITRMQRAVNDHLDALEQHLDED